MIGDRARDIGDRVGVATIAGTLRVGYATELTRTFDDSVNLLGVSGRSRTSAPSPRQVGGRCPSSISRHLQYT